MNPRVSRRRFLRSLGAVPAIAAPVLRASPLHGALAPVRLVVFFTPNGTIPEAWKPTAAGGMLTGFPAGGILEPLAKFRAKLNVLQGVHYSVGRKGPGSNHQKGAGCCLTGRPLLPGDMAGGGGASAGYASGISVDQHIANKIPPQRFRSLEMGVRVRGSGNRQRLSYLGPNQPLPTESDPWKVFARVFASFTGTDSGAAARLLAERRSILDHAKAELGALSRRLPGDERARLERHLHSIRDLERQLTPAPASGLACMPPALGGRIDPLNTTNYLAVGKLQMDLIAAALACQQTRIAHLMWNGSTSDQTFPWIGITSGHHNISHEPDSNADARQKLIAINRMYAEQVAYFLDKLDAVAEAGGRTLLDNTIFVWTNELGKGNNHTLNNIPWVLAGSAGGAIRTGRFLPYTNEPHNNLLVSLMHAMGVTDERTFGDPEFCTGPLRDLI